VWRAANAVISGMIVACAVIIGLVLLGVSLALAFGDFEAKTHLMLSLLRVMFPYMLLVCLTAVFMGMLNARGHFFIPALGATLLNVVLIASVIFLAPRMGRELHEQIYALALGVLVAGVAQAAFQLPSLRGEGFRYAWVTPWRDPTVQRTVRQMIRARSGWRRFTSTCHHPEPGLVVGYPAIARDRALQLRRAVDGIAPGGFGISVATYLLPMLAGLAAEKDFAAFRVNLRQALSHLLLVNLLAAVLLVLLAEPIIRLLFEGRRFGPDATLRAAWALQCLAPSLLAYSWVNILARAFFALGDTKTPMKISVVCLGINLVLAVGLVQWFRQGGLGMANTLSSALNCGLLFYALRRKLKTLELAPLRASLAGLAAAGFAAGVVTWMIGSTWEQALGHGTVVLQLGAVFIPAGAAALVYGLIAWICRVPAITELTDWALARLRRR
jgi:putative peptidoglycan lipid II flippase